MEEKRANLLPIVFAVLIVLPLLYVASYLALVWPDRFRFDLLDSRSEVFPKYRYGSEGWAGRLYWPLEQIDRRVRPDAWVEEE